MNKQTATVTLSLSDFEELQSDGKFYSKLYHSLKDRLKKCLSIDPAGFYAALQEINQNAALLTDQQITDAIKSAESKIAVQIDHQKLHALIMEEYFPDD